MEHKGNQSQVNGIFENKNDVKELEQNKITTSGQSDISTLKSSKPLKDKESGKMDREIFYHWRATKEIIDIVRRRYNSLETRRLVEQRNALSRPGTLRRR